MSDSSSVPSHSDDDGIKITGDIRTVHPRQGYKDEVRTTIVGSGKAAAGRAYANTKAYLGFYGNEIVEVYVPNAGKGSTRVFCGAQWAAIDTRLDLDKTLQPLSQAALTAYIRKRTLGDVARAPRACAESPETLECSPEAGAGAKARDRDAWHQGIVARPQGVRAGDTEARAGGQEGRTHGERTAGFPRIFYMRLVEIAAPLVLFGLGMIVAYFSVLFAFLLLRVAF